MVALVTQREQLDVHGQAIDSIEHNYLQYLKSRGIDHILVSNLQSDPNAFIIKTAPDLIVLTGGGEVSTDLSSARDQMESRLLELAISTRIPLLGICRGLQFINAYFGGACVELESIDSKGRLKPRQRYKAITTPEFVEKMDTEFTITSYHNHGILVDELGDGLIATSRALDFPELVTSVKLANANVWGIIWHPERPGAPIHIDELIFQCLLT